ncbi:metal ABC transporter permease [Salibacterium halotolerans]|uniref:Manganese/zinc/iron transport system permease protein n=1 Tax=Salibacterium halotolerans TaxID=1884432 RepID=A0A1I5V3L3_9BACI|nr:metal ABC transporter permease [Salibacterium halotolerans]SFQ02093.1 manganese/zinc/iron transport system permease protein [Salibacterium halotolerans]
MMQEWLSLLESPNLRWVLLGSMFLGIASGVIGSFVLLRKESLVGEAMSHAALPGVCLGFLAAGRELPALMIGAAVFGFISLWGIRIIHRNTKLKQDTAIGLILSVFFGLGIVLLTMITNSSAGNKSGLDSYIFGQAASMVQFDVWMMSGIAMLVTAAALLFFKEWKLVIFDPLFAGGLGWKTKTLNSILSFSIVLIVTAGIQAVGIILMSALIITPAIAARYWTDRLGIMVILSALIGAFSGLSGAALSALDGGIPTGPVVVLTATAVFVFSFLFAPGRGKLAQITAYRRFRRRWKKQQAVQALDSVPDTTPSRYAAWQKTLGVENSEARRLWNWLKKNRYLT